MSKTCDICGKRRSLGYDLARRGLPKKKGGVGRKITGKTRREFGPNLQRIKVNQNGTVKRLRVCVTCIRSGNITKAATLRGPKVDGGVRQVAESV